MTAYPAFLPYGLMTIVSALNLLALWILSGTVRARTGTAINPEDGVRYSVPTSDVDPPAVARCLRAHRNAEAVIYPFLLVGGVYVLAGGGLALAVTIFSVFIVARIAHSIVYLRAMQPWRTIAFALSLLATLALILSTLCVLLTR
jgi:uncharacterized MAPEG superfamily protein